MIHNQRYPESLPLSRLADTWHLLDNHPDRLQAHRPAVQAALPRVRGLLAALERTDDLPYGVWIP